jgi:hypothetical protein
MERWRNLWRKTRFFALFIFLLSWAGVFAAEEIEEAAVVPQGISQAEYDKLLNQKNSLDRLRSGILSEIEGLNANCSRVSEKDKAKIQSCQSKHDQIIQEMSGYEEKLKNYSAAIKQAQAQVTASPNLSFMEPGGQKGLEMRDVPSPTAAVAPEFDPLSVNTPGEIILIALQKGKLKDKWGPSDLDISINYLDNYLFTKNPYNVSVKQAVSFLEGMRVRAAIEEPKKKDLFAAGPDDARALMEVIAGRNMTLQWPGEKNPDPPGFENPLPWRNQRKQAIEEALAAGKNDYAKSINYLEEKLKKDKDEVDDNSRNALQYLEGYYSYQQFISEQKKSAK